LAKLCSACPPGLTLPQPFYTDPAILQEDLRRVWANNWLYAGHVTQVKEPGDYFLYQIGTDSLIILRGKDGQIRALHNTCRHRGSLVCQEPQGHAKALVCPYHQWVYGTDGSLKTPRHMPEDFDCASHGLYQAAVQVLEGFIFICLSDRPPDFSPLAKDAVPAMRPHGFSKAKPCLTKRYQVKANWKLVVENFRECYHCAGGHPEYCKAVISAQAVDSTSANAEEIRIRTEAEAKWKALGLSTDTVWFTPETWHLVWRFPLSQGFISQSLDGQPVAPLMGSLPHRDLGVLAVTTCPNFWLEASSDYFLTFRLTPLTAGTSEALLQWWVRPDAVEGKDYDLSHVTSVWKPTAEQDWKLCEDNQAGVESSRYQPGPYSNVEGGSDVFVRWYLNQMEKHR
jgi:Rieske 2Fe-2S family protein